MLSFVITADNTVLLSFIDTMDAIGTVPSKISLMRAAVASTEPKSNLEKSKSVFPAKLAM